MRKWNSHAPIGNPFPAIARKMLTKQESIFVELFRTKRIKNGFSMKNRPLFCRKVLHKHAGILKTGEKEHEFFKIGHPCKTSSIWRLSSIFLVKQSKQPQGIFKTDPNKNRLSRRVSLSLSVLSRVGMKKKGRESKGHQETQLRRQSFSMCHPQEINTL